MKRQCCLVAITLLVHLVTGLDAVAQSNGNLQFFRAPDFRGVNQFEILEDTSDSLDETKVVVGGDFTLQFQAIDHATQSGDTLANLGADFNLPTANLKLDVQLANGLRMSVVTYLSSRHHAEAWVKGGHIQMDKLDFIEEGFLEDVMKVLTIRVGLDEINYGDAHFRRSDNARTVYNPFVGNYLMDAFSTEAFGEVYYHMDGLMIMGGVSNGKLNQSVVKGTKRPVPSVYGKIGYDSQINDNLRMRLTGSVYNSPWYDNGQYLYSGDRSGARYYHVMELANGKDDFRSGRFSPGFWSFTAYQINPFIKWRGLEFFGIYELVSGDVSKTQKGGNYTQIGAELLYRIGKGEKLYVGGRYNQVSGKSTSVDSEATIDRINLGGGWFLTDQVVVKAEFVTQNYSGAGWLGTIYEGGEFSGAVLEASIGF